jgi:hypothetical protein
MLCRAPGLARPEGPCRACRLAWREGSFGGRNAAISAIHFSRNRAWLALWALRWNSGRPGTILTHSWSEIRRLVSPRRRLSNGCQNASTGRPLPAFQHSKSLRPRIPRRDWRSDRHRNLSLEIYSRRSILIRADHFSPDGHGQHATARRNSGFGSENSVLRVKIFLCTFVSDPIHTEANTSSQTNRSRPFTWPQFQRPDESDISLYLQPHPISG